MKTSRTPIAQLAASVLCLVVTIVAGYRTRVLIADSAAWVVHTSDVKLAVAEGNLRLEQAVAERPDPAAMSRAFGELRAAEQSVRSLTVDNRAQQVRAGRVLEITDRLASLAVAGRTDAVEWPTSTKGLEELLAEMSGEEDRLMAIRNNVFQRAKERSSYAFVAGAALTVVFATLTVVLFGRQHSALASAEGEIRRQRAMLESVVDSLSEGVLAMTPTKELLVVNNAARTFLGYDFPRDRMPADWRSVIVATREDGTRMPPEQGPLARAARGESVDAFVYHVRNLSAEGDGTWLSASSRPILDSEGCVVAGVVTLRDITEQRRHAEQLRNLSLRDELTQLYNRRGFLVLAEQHMRTVARSKQPFTLLYADLNGLKRINDELGHEAGDRAIADAARILRETFRDSDLVARLGGDEFVALLANADSAKGGALVHRFYENVHARNAEDARYHLSVSVGMVSYDPDQPTPLQELLAEADRRMYSSKEARRARKALQVAVN